MDLCNGRLGDVNQKNGLKRVCFKLTDNQSLIFCITPFRHCWKLKTAFIDGYVTSEERGHQAEKLLGLVQ
uniref:Integrase n=1 Tax=Panagrellus redivivus TaxID=6233 RepID=A0A7E4VKI7_PANRE